MTTKVIKDISFISFLAFYIMLFVTTLALPEYVKLVRYEVPGFWMSALLSTLGAILCAAAMVFLINRLPSLITLMLAIALSSISLLGFFVLMVLVSTILPIVAALLLFLYYFARGVSLSI